MQTFSDGKTFWSGAKIGSSARKSPRIVSDNLVSDNLVWCQISGMRRQWKPHCHTAAQPHCGNQTATLTHNRTVALYHTATLPHCDVASARPVGELDSVGLARQQNIFRHLKCWNDGMGIIDLDRTMEINQALASKKILTRCSMTSLSLTLGAPGQVFRIKTCGKKTALLQLLNTKV